jgi:hypothetical protein
LLSAATRASGSPRSAGQREALPEMTTGGREIPDPRGDDAEHVVGAG